jgi:alanyl-tRNA synthetase
MLCLNEVRSKFINFFVAHKHKEVSSAPLIPASDPTLLFTNAGMVPFKNIFTGEEERSYKTAVSSQKCLRAGGKHNDLENVGFTARHHTFFEMLGNFSFGDYFKEKAIRLAWDFLTVELKIPTEKLWVSIYHEDKEAEDIWLNKIKIDPNRFSRIATLDNFWQMGDTGPCGPCTEIFYDHGKEIKGGPPGSPDEDGDRYIEIWNLVFMQFNKRSDGTMERLPSPCVDTGMGLERLVAVLQGVHDNYDIDLFQNLLTDIDKIFKIKDNSNRSLRVIADHIRAISFMICDGIIPSNEGRGYVLRRIIRRAARHGFKLGVKKEFLYSLLPALIKQMGDFYPKLVELSVHIQKIIKGEEEKFTKTLSTGLDILKPHLKQNSTLDGKIIFKLYDTYGFPPDLTADICREYNIKQDKQGFEEEMKKQKIRAKSSGKFKTQDKLELKNTKKTEFFGYGNTSLENAEVLQIFCNNISCEKITEKTAKIVLDKTCFYATSGGQVGDIGMLKNEKCKLEVAATNKQGDVIIHNVKLLEGNLKVGDKLTLSVPTKTRAKISANHSATHLLQAALKKVLGEHIQQKGSLVDDNGLRFDFSHYQGLKKDEINKIQAIVNDKIRENISCQSQIMNIEDAKKSKAISLFDEKYGEEVRLIKFSDFSYEFCGGTHVKQTSDIGLFVIKTEQSISSGTRRIEALTGGLAFDYLLSYKQQISDINKILQTDKNNLNNKISQIIAENKELKILAKKQATSNTSDIIQSLKKQAKHSEDTSVISAHLNNSDKKSLQVISSELQNQLKSLICILTTIVEKRIILIVSTSSQLSKKYPANKIIAKLLPYIDGKGGGKPNLAQGGGTKVSKIDKLHKVGFDILKETFA